MLRKVVVEDARYIYDKKRIRKDKRDDNRTSGVSLTWNLLEKR